MNRAQAIDHLTELESYAEQNRCVGSADIAAEQREFLEALVALGVTPEELRAADWEAPA